MNKKIGKEQHSSCRIRHALPRHIDAERSGSQWRVSVHLGYMPEQVQDFIRHRQRFTACIIQDCTVGCMEPVYAATNPHVHVLSPH